MADATKDIYGSWVSNSSFGRIRLHATIDAYIYSDHVDFYLGMRLNAEYAISDSSNLFSISGNWSRSASSISVSTPSGGGTDTLWSEAVSSGHLYRVYGSPGQTVTASVSSYIDNLYEYNNKASVSGSLSVTIPATVPDAPVLTATTASSSQINLSWTTPANNGSALDNYTLQVSSTSSTTGFTNLFSDSSVPLATTYSHTGLGKNTTHWYRVLASNGVGNSAYSAVKSATTSSTVPGTPTGLTATEDVTSISLTWVAPTDTGGVPLTGYTVKRNGVTVYNGTLNSFTDTGLSPATQYTYTVAAKNSVGTGIANGLIATTIGGVVGIWNGSTNVKVLPKIWNGTSWVDSNARIWNGTEWKYGI